MKINYLKGDATQPIGDGTKIIPHISNNWGVWGAGFVLAISKRWKLPQEYYRAYPTSHILGNVQYVHVEDDIIVANMIAQHGIGPDLYGKPPIRYCALEKCLKDVNRVAQELNATIHAPKFGSGLAGGNWSVIEEIINKVFHNVQVNIYEY